MLLPTRPRPRCRSEARRQFEEFVTSTTERELRQLRETFARRRGFFTTLETTTEAAKETIKEVRLEHESKANIIDAALAQNENRRLAVTVALADDKDLNQDCPAIASASGEAVSIVAEIDSRIKSLNNNSGLDTRKKLTDEAQELRARALLGKHELTLLDEIENKKKSAAYGQCIEETRPTTITQKSSAVTKAVVSEQLKQSFKVELQKLGFTHIEVDAEEVGGTEGVFYHKLILTRNPGVELPRIVSEGESAALQSRRSSRNLALPSTLRQSYFDDPVSALDFEWRNRCPAFW